MPGKKLSRNAPCPCGSGKKYKHCCYDKGFTYNQNDDGTISKSIPVPDEIADLLDEQRQMFIDQHGREPGPGDPLLFDTPHSEQIEHQLTQIMEQAGIDPAIIYAFQKTGMIVSDDNLHLLSDADLGLYRQRPNNRTSNNVPKLAANAQGQRGNGLAFQRDSSP
jgi:hypothetical protein